MRHKATKERAAFPFAKWDRVGWKGHRAEIRKIDRLTNEIYIYFLDHRYVYPKWVSITELTDLPDPPPPTDSGDS